MKKIFRTLPLIAAAVLMTQCKPAQTTPQEDPDEYIGYLFAYFTGNAVVDEQVCYAVSGDSLDFHALNGNQPVIASKDISSTGGVRDPFILRCEGDSTFYMVCTDMTSSKGWDSNRAMVLLKSNDLVKWTSAVVNIQEKYEGQEELKRVWAPQVIYDKEAGKYLVYFSMKHGDGPDIIYYAYANADFTDLEGEPKPLFIPENKLSCIDGDIIVKDGVYHMFYKTEGHGDGIKQAVTNALTSGQWEERPDYVQQTTDAVEGSGIFRMINSDKYVLMYDVYKAHRYEFCETTDLEHFSIIENNVKMNFHPRHGCVIPITRAEMQRLTEAFPEPAEPAQN